MCLINPWKKIKKRFSKEIKTALVLSFEKTSAIIKY